MSLGVLPKAEPRPPALNDPSKYVRFPRVPVFTKHLRKLVNKETGEVRYTSVDDNQLKVICDNTNKKVQKQDFPLVLLGHRDLSKPETEQPPVVGFLGRHEIGIYDGEPAILAEMFIKQEYSDAVDQYPRRSAETWGKELPTGYIDAIALLKRVPELNLGLITNHSREDSGFEIFECQCQEKFNMPEKTEAENRGDELARDEEVGTENTPSEENEPSEESNPEEPSENEDSSVDKKALETFAKAVAPHLAEHLAKHPRHHKELAKHVSKHLTEHFSRDADMHEAIGKSVAKHMSEDPSHHDGLIKRISDLLEDASEHEGKERDEAENGPEKEETENHAAGGAGTPIAANTNVPGPVKGDGMENHSTDPNVAIGLLTVRLEKAEGIIKELTEKNSQLEAFSKQQQAEATTAKRRLRLQTLVDNEGIDIDVDEKLEQFSKFDDEMFETFAKDIQRNYARRAPANQPLIKTAPMNGIPKKPGTLPADDLTEAEIRDGAVEIFRKETNFEVKGPQDGVNLVKAYFAKADRSKYIGKK